MTYKTKVFLLALLLTVCTSLGTAKGGINVDKSIQWEVNNIPHQIQIYYPDMDTWISYSYFRVPCDYTGTHPGTKIFRVGNDCYLGDLNTPIFVKLSGEKFWTPVFEQSYKGQR